GEGDARVCGRVEAARRAEDQRRRARVPVLGGPLCEPGARRAQPDAAADADTRGRTIVKDDTTVEQRAHLKRIASLGGQATNAKRKAARGEIAPYAGTFLDFMAVAGLTGDSWATWR